MAKLSGPTEAPDDERARRNQEFVRERVRARDPLWAAAVEDAINGGDLEVVRQRRRSRAVRIAAGRARSAR
jgi:hypothetical protein